MRPLFLFLGLISQYRHSDARRAYQCMKLCVSACNKHNEYSHRLLYNSESGRWQAAVQWLTEVLSSGSGGGSTSYGKVSFSDSTADGGGDDGFYWKTSYVNSNEGSHSSAFKRTKSAQVSVCC